MCRTVMNPACSRSPGCPFLSTNFPWRISTVRSTKYENERFLLLLDVQIEMKRSIAAALGERKGWTSERKIHAVVYPYSADDVWGPRRAIVTLKLLDLGRIIRAEIDGPRFRNDGVSPSRLLRVRG